MGTVPAFLRFVRRPVSSCLGVLLLSAVMLAPGCSTRERSNPFDPNNPSTGGAPSNFRAAAADRRVTLTWDPVSSSALLGFQLFRRLQGESVFTDLEGLLPTVTSTFTDAGRMNGVDATYRLHFVRSSGLDEQFVEDTATPGPIIPYVTEFLNGTVSRTTPDGRHITFRAGGFDSPNDVAVDPRTGVQWVTDTFANAVEILAPTGEFHRVSGLGQPGAIALDGADETAWICEPGGTTVSHYTRFGTLANPARLNAIIDNPLGIDVDPINRTVWICERGGNQVRAFQQNGSQVWATALAAPLRVAVDSVTKAGWVTSFESGQVTALSSTGARIDSVTNLAGPIGIEIDPRRGLVWIADALAGKIVVVDRMGNVQFTVGGLSQVREIDIDLRTGNGWATVPGLGSVVVISPAGVQLRLLGGFIDPSSVAIDPGP